MWICDLKLQALLEMWPQLGVVAHVYNPSYSGGGELQFEASLGKKLARPMPMNDWV
jgi:hypothetical protein